MNKLLATLLAGLWAVGAWAQAPAAVTIAPPAIHKTTTLADVKMEMKETPTVKTHVKKAHHAAHKAHHHPAKVNADSAVTDKAGADKK